MRSLSGNSRVNLCSLIGLLAATLALTAIHQVGDAFGQSQTPTPFPPIAGQNSGRPTLGQEPEPTQDPMLRRAQEDAAKKRNIDRQKRLLADSDKIVQLAKDLNTATAPNEKDPASPAMAKKAEEIEKLARSVKELMKSD